MDKVKNTILLVEDEIITAMLEKKQLESIGYSITHVMNGEDAIQEVLGKNIYFDLILMDIDLGSGIDGTQAAEEILKEKDIPIVFLSSHTESEIVEKTEKITSYGYVVKNTGIVVLDASIKMALKLFDANLNKRLINEKMESALENLRVHQVELQMQNEELSAKQEELEVLQSKYVDLYDFAPAGYFTLSKSGLILEANLTGSDLLGVTRSVLLNQPFTSFIISEDHDIFYIHRKKLFDDGTPQTCELRIKRNDGLIFPVYIKAVSKHEGNESETCLVIMIEHSVNVQDIKHLEEHE
jgi:PAS domain S-box-containing protein